MSIEMLRNVEKHRKNVHRNKEKCPSKDGKTHRNLSCKEILRNMEENKP
jgi:hypothetical protein